MIIFSFARQTMKNDNILFYRANHEMQGVAASRGWGQVVNKDKLTVFFNSNIVENIK